METHEVECPQCHALILGHLAPNEDQSGFTPTEVFVIDSVVGGGPRSAATPAAERRAAETGVDLSEVQGSGAPREVVVEQTVTQPTVTQADVDKAAAKLAAEVDAAKEQALKENA